MADESANNSSAILGFISAFTSCGAGGKATHHEGYNLLQIILREKATEIYSTRLL